MANIHRIVSQGIPIQEDPTEFIGRVGDLIVAPLTGVVTVHDGTTPGGREVGGSLEGFMASLLTDAPNDDTNASLFEPSGGSTDQDMVLRPKGAGALLLSVPDGTGFGGNKRGAYAVDLQNFSAGKNSPTQIASGNYSFSCNVSNTSSGEKSFTEGWLNTASDMASHAEGVETLSSAFASHAEGSNTSATASTAHAEGESTIASNNQAHAEGNSTTASGPQSHSQNSSTTASGSSSHAGGFNTLSSGDYSFTHGIDSIADAPVSFATGQGSVTKGIAFNQVYSTGRFGGAGINQSGRLGLKAETSDDTQTAMTSDLQAAASYNQLLLLNGSACAISGTVVAYASSTDSAMFTFTVLMRCTDNGTLSLIGSDILKVYASAGASGWEVGLAPNQPTQALGVYVTGDVGNTIRWSAELRSQEVQLQLS